MGTFLLHSLHPYCYMAKPSPPNHWGSEVLWAREGQYHAKKHWPEIFFHSPGSCTHQLEDLGKLSHLCEPWFSPL